MIMTNLTARLFKTLTFLLVGVSMSLSVQAQTVAQKSPDLVVKDTVSAIVADIQENRDVYKKDKQALTNSTDAQKAEFAKEFQTFLLNIYAPALLEYTGNEKVEYQDTDLTTGKDKVEVNASLTAANGQVYPIVLSMSNRDDTQWRAYNINIAGIDFVRTYRSAFEPIIAKKGIDGLIADLRKKNTQ